jgi:hypothetical protein
VFSKPPIHYASSCLWDENGETLQYKRLMMGKHLRRIKEGRSRRKSGTSNYESGLTSVTGEQERRVCTGKLAKLMPFMTKSLLKIDLKALLMAAM